MAVWAELLLSLFIFAPGIILLGVLLFVGALIGLEKIGILGRLAPRLETAGGPAPATTAIDGPGPVVAGLKSAVDTPVATPQEVGVRKTGVS